MKKIWLSNNGAPTIGDDHISMARTILGGASKADSEYYRLMWAAGWVRVVEMPDRLFGERMLAYGKRTDVLGEVPFLHLSPEQRRWLEDHGPLAGKKFYWNNGVFESTREGRSNASRAAQVLMAG